jgi:phosphohistidine phosphatase
VIRTTRPSNRPIERESLAAIKASSAATLKEPRSLALERIGMWNGREFPKRVYLVQHGEAKSEQEDPERPRTERGRDEVTRVARFVAAAGRVRVERIVHSGKTRARQTAEILNANLRPPAGMSQIDGLAPNDDPSIAARIVAETSEVLTFAGHLPHLSRLASLLIFGETGKMPVYFRMGGIVALGQDDQGLWSVAWHLIPDIVPK